MPEQLPLAIGDPTAILLEAVEEAHTRDDVARAWAANRSRGVNWCLVRSAILDRWSPSGLRYIEGRALGMRLARFTRNVAGRTGNDRRAHVRS